jgi:hypothetical protein
MQLLNTNQIFIQEMSLLNCFAGRLNQLSSCAKLRQAYITDHRLQCDFIGFLKKFLGLDFFNFTKPGTVLFIAFPVLCVVFIYDLECQQLIVWKKAN